MITKQDIRTAVSNLGIADADVCIHSSMKSFGDTVEGGAPAIVEAFLESGCTVLAPSFSFDFEEPPNPRYQPERNADAEYVYLHDQIYMERRVFSVVSNSIADGMGALPRCILERPDRQRGYHPLNSFVAVGKRAAELVEDQSPKDVYAPFERLCKNGGYVLLMGVGLERATIIHYAEQLAGRSLFIRWARGRSGDVIPVSIGSCSDGFGKLDTAVERVQKCVTVGRSLWRWFPAGAMADICAGEIARHPEITRCDDPGCARCPDAVAGGPVLSPGFWDGAGI